MVYLYITNHEDTSIEGLPFMLQGLSTSLNKIIERFQDQWELNPAFRTMWSVIGCAFAIVFLCSSLLVGMNVANSFTKGNGTSNGNNGGIGIQGGNPLNPTYSVKQVSGNTTMTPGANPIATSGAATPTPTIPATPDTPTPSTPDQTPSATADPNLTVSASQSPLTGWSGATPNQNQIINVTTNPPVPNAQIVFQLDFGCQQIPVQGNLDGNGQTPSISVSIPGCFKSKTPKPIPITVSINGQQIPQSQVQLQPNQFTATA
jgi:hypothetical protein